MSVPLPVDDEAYVGEYWLTFSFFSLTHINLIFGHQSFQNAFVMATA